MNDMNDLVFLIDKDQSGFRFQFYTSVEDIEGQKIGEYVGGVSIEIFDSNSAPFDDEDKIKYHLSINLAEYTEEWGEKFIDDFCLYPKFRDQFLRHTKTSILLNGKNVDIDASLVPAIEKLNQLGVETNNCCQGDCSGTPYISLSDNNVFPQELIDSWTGAGFDVQKTVVYASSPYLDFEGRSSKPFIQSLQDWIDNKLDLTGKKYKIKPGKQKSSLPRLPSQVGFQMTNQEDNSNLITEVLEDGTIYSFDLDLCDEEAENAIAYLWEQEGKTLNFDFSSAVFQTFVKSIGILSRSGWSTEDLFQEVANHSEADDNICECCGKRRNDPVHDHEDGDEEDED